MKMMIVALFVLAFIAIAFLMSRFSGGTPGGTDSTSFPFGTDSIAPPSWSPDSGSDDSQCEVGDGGWSDGGSDSGSCDSGDSGSSSSSD